MDKLRIFISHITEEKEIAITLKNIIEKKFLKIVEVFVSSDEESIKLGNEWFDIIKQSMKESSITIVICSPISIFKPWINFEAGAGWMNNNPVIPFCHSGLIPGDLPFPLKSFQGGQLNKEGDLKKLFKIIADFIGTDTPEFDDNNFISTVSIFEANVKKSLLLKDTTFIFNIFKKQIIFLEYCIYSSTTEYEVKDYFEVVDFNISEYVFTFKSMINIFNNSASLFGYEEKIYETYYKTINQLIDNTKFILTYNNINIPSNLRDLFNDLLDSSIMSTDWYYAVYTVDHNDSIKENIIEEIIKYDEKQKIKTGNFINPFIMYYESLRFYKIWITRFLEETNKILH